MSSRSDSTFLYDVTVIGEIYQDHIFSGFEAWPSLGEEILTDSYNWELGGGAIITACALARLGRSVQVIGVVGAAEIHLLSERLADFNVTADHLLLSERRTGVTVSISTVQDRSFFTYRGANDELPARLVQDSAMLSQAARARHIHLAMPLPASLAEQIIPSLRQHNATLSLDVGHHLDWLQDEASFGVLGQIDYTMPNEKETAVLSGGAQQYLQRCRDLGLRNAVVKLGGEGAAMLRDGQEFCASPPTVSVVDTTGAGDVFDAGFIDALLDQQPPLALLARACACGALSTRVPGALGALPTREEVSKILQRSDVA